MAVEFLGFDIPVWLLLCLALAVVAYVYGTRTFGVWKKLGIRGPTPYPFIGTLLGPILSRRDVYEVNKGYIKKYGKVVGQYQGSRPVLMVADLDMIKEIQIKEFRNFTNHSDDSSISVAPLNMMLISIKDDHWRHIRATVSPTFSSGKMRKMKTCINRCSKLLVENLMTKAKSGEAFDVKERMRAYTTDVIASTAFGLDIDSQRDPKDPFNIHSKAMDKVNSNPFIIIFLLAPALANILMKYFGVSIFDKEAMKFFNGMVDQAMNIRTEGVNDKRNDFLQLIVNAHKDNAMDEKDEHHEEYSKNSNNQHQRKGLTHDEVLAQSFIFFLAGFSTVSDGLTFMLYALATNQDEQEKLLQEIQEVLKDNQEPDYDALNKMHFLEMVVNESLRLYAPAPITDRQCSKDTVIKGVHIPKGTIIYVPIQNLHMDPDVWPEPEKFDPERFSPERKADINPYAWQPFGTGPRACVGMRLALMELKTALVYMVRNFKIQTCEKTNIPVKRNLMGQPVDVFLKLETRG